MHRVTFVLAFTTAMAAGGAVADSNDPEYRALATAKAMTPAERTTLTHGISAIPSSSGPPLPADAVPGAGYVPGIQRLSIPALKETDASLGVAYIGGIRHDGATALPSGMAMASTWDPELLYQGGAMIGSEARAKGFNVMLAGGSNLMRDSRNGRTFEYLGEDPLLTGILAGAAIRGIQSNHIISTIKHFALNNQETARRFANVTISDAAVRESDLLAFEIAIEKGQPGAVMCAYNKVNGHYGCDNDYLLNRVLKHDWGYQGFVMSDWGAVPGVQAAANGLDQQSAAELDDAVFFNQPLATAAARDNTMAARLLDMNKRILYAIYANKLDRDPPVKTAIDFKKHGDIAQKFAEQGIVLLRNRNHTLPLGTNTQRIAVIGGYADSGVLSGSGSSQVMGEGGPAVTVSLGGDGSVPHWVGHYYHHSVPLKALKARAPHTQFRYRDGRYITDAVTAARQADVAIVFATQWMTEGLDLPDLSLPNGQDALIAAVADANPHTIVVLETGGPVLMPWLNKTAAVVEAWYPGARGAKALTRILYGDVNPSGRLPASFPKSLAQLPRPILPGSDTVEPNFEGRGAPGQRLNIDYMIEGADVGYRWFAAQREKPLFPFGYGLSYTRFAATDLQIEGTGLMASFTLTNSGLRKGADVAQIYLTSAAGSRMRRLVAFQRVELAAGEHRQVKLPIDPRLLAHWNGKNWTVKGDSYTFALGESAEQLGKPVTVAIAGQQLKP